MTKPMPWWEKLAWRLLGQPTHDIVYCDLCRKRVAGARPAEGDMPFTIGYYHDWPTYMDLDEEDVCEPCMWADPNFQAVYGRHLC